MKAINTWEDGQDFSPDRWLNKDTLPGKVGGWSNISSFSEGPRMCIGYKLGTSPGERESTLSSTSHSTSRIHSHS